MSLNSNDLHLVIISGFGGNNDISNLEEAISEKLNINPDNSRIIKGCPPYKAFHHPEVLVADIRGQIEDISSNNILIVGHSYGALLALAAATRTHMHNVIKLILIDGPLGLGTPIEPTKLAHHLFKRQYDYRPKLAGTCLDDLGRQGSKNIVTIASRNDRIIPYEMKILPGLHSTPVQEDPKHGVRFLERIGGTQGMNMTLPLHLGGHRLSEKIPIIASIIGKLTPADLIQQDRSEIEIYMEG